jgi:arginyl-tRNA--protein-N-Asp/Glu arginylyltransferase
VTKEPRDGAQFYLTAPSPCPYLVGRQERKVFTHLIGRGATTLNDALTTSGFRRSQTIAYRPACEACRSCVSVRMKVRDYTPSRGRRRVLARNGDLEVQIRPPVATAEQYALFSSYVDTRHGDGGMADMGYVDYQTMVEDSHVSTCVTEYREEGADRLVACCLTDRLADGLSMVYSFFDPSLGDRSLGVFMILEHVSRTRSLGLENLYLGYWVEGSPKMAYKASFLPQERLGVDGWTRVG